MAEPLVGPLIGPPASTGYWLRLGAMAWQRELDARLRPLGLTTAQFSVLAGASWTARSGTPPTQQQVADFAGLDRMLTSKLLQAMQASGLVERLPDADDGRVRRVRATAAGQQAVRDAGALARAVDADFFGPDISLRDDLRTVFAEHRVRPTGALSRG